MQRFRRAVSLPLDLELRFVASRVLMFLPVFSALLWVFWRMHTAWFPLFLAKYIFLLAIVSWSAWRRSERERFSIERYAAEDPEFARLHGFDRGKDHLLPLIGAVLIIGAAWSAGKGDVRWLLLTSILGGLLALGLLLRWLVYERWVSNQLVAVRAER